LYGYINSFVTGGSADKITIQSKGGGALGAGSYGLGDNDFTAIRRTSGVYDLTGYYTKIAQIQSRDIVKYGISVGIDPSKQSILEELWGVKIDQGQELHSGDMSKVVLGYSYEIDNKIFPKGLSVNDEILIQGQKVKVIGFYQEIGNPSDDSNIYMTQDFFKQLYPNTTYYSMIVAKADTSNITQIVDNIDKSLLTERKLKAGQEDFSVASFDQLLSSYSSALNIVIGFIILIALISVFVSAINTSNTMITSVLERMKEIGIIKSIGARNSEVLSLFLFESGILGLVAGTLGVILGYGMTTVAGYILKQVGFGFLQPGYSIWLFLGCIAFATLTGAISGIVPAIHASRIRPVEALRYE
jgi:putative ABC transport system permease protein